MIEIANGSLGVVEIFTALKELDTIEIKRTRDINHKYVLSYPNKTTLIAIFCIAFCDTEYPNF